MSQIPWPQLEIPRAKCKIQNEAEDRKMTSVAGRISNRAGRRYSRANSESNFSSHTNINMACHNTLSRTTHHPVTLCRWFITICAMSQFVLTARASFNIDTDNGNTCGMVHASPTTGLRCTNYTKYTLITQNTHKIHAKYTKYTLITQNTH